MDNNSNKERRDRSKRQFITLAIIFLSFSAVFAIVASTKHMNSHIYAKIVFVNASIAGPALIGALLDWIGRGGKEYYVIVRQEVFASSLSSAIVLLVSAELNAKVFDRSWSHPTGVGQWLLTAVIVVPWFSLMKAIAEFIHGRQGID